jgi:hypothetical protein
MTKARDLSQVPNASLGFKNRLINGDMRIDQRNNGASVNTHDSFPVDRFLLGNTTDGVVTAQRDTTAPDGFINSLKFTTTTADASLSSTQFCNVRQRVEGLNVADLGWGTANAQPVTLSFKVRSSLTGTFGGSIANSSFDRSYPFTYTISSANTWTTISVTVQGDTTGTWLTSNGTGMQIIFGLGVGSAYSGTAGAWAATGYLSVTGATSVVGTSGATFYITGVMLEKGSTATNYDVRPYGTELSLCQRYYEVGSGSLRSWGIGIFNGTHVTFKVQKRATPSMTYLATGPVSSNNSFSGFVTQDVWSAGVQFNANNSNGEQYNYGFTVAASSEL